MTGIDDVRCLEWLLLLRGVVDWCRCLSNVNWWLLVNVDWRMTGIDDVRCWTGWGWVVAWLSLLLGSIVLWLLLRSLVSRGLGFGGRVSWLLLWFGLSWSRVSWGLGLLGSILWFRLWFGGRISGPLLLLRWVVSWFLWSLVSRWFLWGCTK